MKTNGRVTPWLLILLLTVAGSASAFDGKRTGFCLGFGAGLGTITYSDDGASDHKTLNGFQTTLDIGAGITDRLLILYSGHTTFNTTPDSPYGEVIWNELTVIVRYYFKPAVRSFYIFGGPAAAVGVGWDDYGIGGGGLGGFGFAAGVGYQIDRHFQLELGAVITSGSNTSFRSFHATVNVMGY